MLTFNAASLLLFISFVREVASHGYIISPRSRNFIAGIDGVWSGGGINSYPKDSCAHCANRGGTLGECGYTGNYYYDVPRSILGNVMPADPQAVYAQGAVIDVEVVLTAHHMGHFDFYACPIQHGQAPTSSCLKQYPLEFVSDPLYGAVKDVNYPNRAYIAPRSYGLKQDSTLASGDFFHFKMKLPNHLIGDLVLLQWHYWTANSCKYEGYDEYPFPSAWGNMQSGLGICGPNPDGNGLPEQFWNCAEIKVVGGPISSPVATPTPQSTPSPAAVGTAVPIQTANPVPIQTANPAPTNAPNSPLVPSPSLPVSGTCGNGVIGNGQCANNILCCSEWGWCGSTPDHCKSQPVPTGPPVLAFNPTMLLPAPPSLATVTPISFPGYANGQCSGLTNVMSVNFGYYQSWAIWRNSACNRVTPTNIDVEGNSYTHLAYSFASINSSFELEPWNGNFEEEVPQYIEFNTLKTRYPQLKTMIAVGGWSFNDPGPTYTRFSDTASTAANRATFAASCVRFCQQYGFDGVDLDWEYPGASDRGGIAADKSNLSLLVQAIRAAFDNASVMLELSMAVPVSANRLDPGYDLPTLAAGIDFFNIMAYDIYGPWSTSIGANADMSFIFNTIQYFLNAGVSPNKIVLGLAAYGRTFNLASSSCTSPGCSFTGAGLGGCAGEPGYMPYFTIDEYIQSGNYYSMNFNNITGTMEMVIDNNVWITFDSLETLNIKADFASKSCLRGYMWWAVDLLKSPLVLTTGSLLSSSPVTSPLPTVSPVITPAPSTFPIQTANPAPTNQPTLPPFNLPTAAPVIQTANPAPTNVPTTALPTTSPNLPVSGTCGNGVVGNGQCADSSLCCSEWGWCGITVDHCKNLPVVIPSSSPVITPSPTSSPMTTSPTAMNWQDWTVSTSARCGLSELDARGNCRKTCTSRSDCDANQDCWGVYPNFCGSKPQPEGCNKRNRASRVGFRCGYSEIHARETCGERCHPTQPNTCGNGQTCMAVFLNFCDCNNSRMLRAVNVN